MFPVVRNNFSTGSHLWLVIAVVYWITASTCKGRIYTLSDPINHTSFVEEVQCHVDELKKHHYAQEDIGLNINLLYYMYCPFIGRETELHNITNTLLHNYTSDVAIYWTGNLYKESMLSYTLRDPRSPSKVMWCIANSCWAKPIVASLTLIFRQHLIKQNKCIAK